MNAEVQSFDQDVKIARVVVDMKWGEKIQDFDPPVVVPEGKFVAVYGPKNPSDDIVVLVADSPDEFPGVHPYG